jgi:hypothetical protein
VVQNAAKALGLWQQQCTRAARGLHKQTHAAAASAEELQAAGMCCHSTTILTLSTLLSVNNTMLLYAAFVSCFIAVRSFLPTAALTAASHGLPLLAVSL